MSCRPFGDASPDGADSVTINENYNGYERLTQGEDQEQISFTGIRESHRKVNLRLLELA